MERKPEYRYTRLENFYLFSVLFSRCGIRANHKIPYEQFLEKFQAPVTKGNGQTIPIKPNHKYVNQLIAKWLVWS